jgi:hypothetical protein
MVPRKSRIAQVYLWLCVFGGLLPLRHIAMFFVEHGPDSREFIAQIYQTRVGAFFTADVVASAVVLAVFVAIESKRLGIRRYWVPYLGLIVGVSLAFPWFLYLRQRQIETTAHA